MNTEIDHYRSLVELGVVTEDDLDTAGDAAQRLSRVINLPLRRLTLVDLYLLTRANLALFVVAQLVIERLESTPLLQAAEYPADLLTALLETDARFWLEHREIWESALPMLATAMEQAATTSDEGEVTYAIGDTLAAAVLHFMSHHKP